MDLINIFTEIGTTLSPLLAIILVYIFNKLMNAERRIARLEMKSDKSLESLQKIQIDIEMIKVSLVYLKEKK